MTRTLIEGETMIKVLAVLLALALSNRVMATESETERPAPETFEVSCVPPENFSGNAVTLTGTLTVEDLGEEYPLAMGTLQMTIGGSSLQSESKPVGVLGGRLDDGAFMLGAPDDESITVIYLNAEMSYLEKFVEEDSKTYLMVCTVQKTNGDESEPLQKGE